MVERFSEGRLEAALISVGEHLVLPAEAESPAVDVDPALRTRRAHRVLVAAAVVVAIVAATLLAPPARSAVARWFGIGSTEVRVVPNEEASGTGLPEVVDGLAPTSARDAASILDHPLPDTSATALGAPDNIYEMPEGGVLLVWSDQSATLWIRPRQLDPETIFSKLISADQDVEKIDDLGDAGLLIVGDHTLLTPHRRLAARSVILWTDDGVEYRFESDLAREALVEFARSVN